MRRIFNIIFFLSFLSSCGSVTEGFKLKKGNTGDEFLVEKKNPLVLPPNFNELPTPKDVVDNTQIENIENEIEDLLSSIKDNNEEAVESSSSTDTESFVLEKIKD